jgi:hypothetical protein
MPKKQYGRVAPTSAEPVQRSVPLDSVIHLRDRNPFTEGPIQNRTLDLNPNISNADDDGVIIHLSAISQGSDVANRQAMRVVPTELSVRIWLAADPAYSDVTSQAFRAVLFQDLNQASDTATTPGEVLETVGSAYAPFTHAFDAGVPGKVQILDDQVAIFDKYHVSTLLQLKASNLGRKMQKVFFNGSSSSDIQKNGLYLLVISSASTSPTPANYWSRGSLCESRLIFTNQ